MTQSPDKARAYHLLRTYGLTPTQYLELYEKQSGKCATCLKHQDELKQRLAVDHDHKTLEIRGLLCQHCNHRIVGRHTDASLLRRVADHLEAHTGWFVPQNFKKRRKRRASSKSVCRSGGKSETMD